MIYTTLSPKQNGLHFANDTFKLIFLNENDNISIKVSLKFVPKLPLNNIPALVQIMAWCRPGDKPFAEPMVVILPTLFTSLGLNELTALILRWKYFGMTRNPFPLYWPFDLWEVDSIANEQYIGWKSCSTSSRIGDELRSPDTPVMSCNPVVNILTLLSLSAGWCPVVVSSFTMCRYP